MKAIRFSSPYTPASEKDVVTIERKLGVILPADYRSFLIQFNGGVLADENDFFVSSSFPGGEAAVSLIYSATKQRDVEIRNSSGKMERWEDLNNLMHGVKAYKGRIPSSLLPIADDGCGNQICLGIKGVDYGKVFFWDHEQEEGARWWEPRKARIPSRREEYRDNVWQMAGSFSEFIDGLGRCP